MLTSLKPKDCIAIITLVGIFVLKGMGYNGGIDTAGALILGYYFAHRRDGTDDGL
jgi:hypothetical protein